jgi:dynein heavy chain 1, cytosolic
LFTPEAYVTASRQCVAQTNQWSLEELVLHVIVQDSLEQQTTQDECTFAIRGLRLQGAKCRANKLHLSSSISTELNLTLFKWIRATERKQQVNPMITLPVYLNPTRSELLFTIDLESADNSLNEFDFYERGVAVLTSAIA